MIFARSLERQPAMLVGLAFALGVLAGAGTSGRAPVAPPAPAAPAGETGTRYAAEVVRVIDGDTFEARVRLWPGLEATTKVRLRGIDAPELNARCTAEQVRAERARDALAALLAGGEVWIAAVGADKYGGRVLARASTAAVADLGEALRAAGLARPYAGGRRQGWCAAEAR